tara:strand:+ start:3810 stop:4535 length:726 start_codon:yes stop_codon:yes gene_type:complete
MNINERLERKVYDYVKEHQLNKDDVKAFHTYIEHEKGFEINVKENAEDDAKYLTIKAYIMTFGNAKNPDRGGDFIAPTAFDKDMRGRKGMIMLKDHDQSVSSVVGHWYKFKKDDKGWLATGKLYKTPETEHVYEMVKNGAINTVSIGGIWVYEDGPKNTKQIIKGKLFETSIVAVPMNKDALITSVDENETKSFVAEDVKQKETEKQLQVDEKSKPMIGLSEFEKAKIEISARMILEKINK